MAFIDRNEFLQRVNQIRNIMSDKGLDAVVIFGDEYRREYVRYTSNFWPIFEKSAVFIFKEGEPILGVAPECENYAKESSVWNNIRNIKGFGCVTVPEEIDFPLARIYSFKEIFEDFLIGPVSKKVGIVGMDLLTIALYKLFRESLPGFKFININNEFNFLRLIKSKNEIACLKKSFEIADLAYYEMMNNSVTGKTEYEVAAAGEFVARKNGAEYVPFCNVSSGERTNTVIGRATGKKLKKGEIMSVAIAVQYNGYISTVQFPYTVSLKLDKRQAELIKALLEAEIEGLKYLKNGIRANEFVKAVRGYFSKKSLSKYDIYPPLHGCGTAEAESPYPDEKSKYPFLTGMTVNTDISLFGTEAYSNRIEEGFIITDNGYSPMSKLVRRLSKEFINKQVD